MKLPSSLYKVTVAPGSQRFTEGFQVLFDDGRFSKYRFKDGNRCIATLDPHIVEFPEGNRITTLCDSGIAGQNSRAIDFVDALQTGCEVYGVTHDSVIEPFTRTDIADQHITGVDANAGRNFNIIGQSKCSL